MKFRISLISCTALALTIALALPASAAPGDSGASITLSGGVLAITVPSGTTSLGSRANTVGGGAISGPLGSVVVSDARSAAAGAGWVASAISTAFTPVGATPTIGALAVDYDAGVITKVGTATYVADNPANLSGVAAVVTATGITGDNSASWNPTVTVTVPGGMAADVYSAVITHSVV